MVGKKKTVETPRDLRKQSKRMEASRDNLKNNKKKKSAEMKRLRSSVDDLKVSRNSWKAQCKQSTEENVKLRNGIKDQLDLFKESERIISEKDNKLLELQKECEELKKK